MSEQEFHKWRRYEEEEPFLSRRIDVIGGVIASTLANVHRGRTTTSYAPTDFMPFFSRAVADAKAEQHRQAHAPPAVDEDDAVLMRLVSAFGGSFGRVR